MSARRRSRWFALTCLIAAWTAWGTARAAPLVATDFPSLGANPFTKPGMYTFNTTGMPPTLMGPMGLSINGVIHDGIAVFTFDSIDIGTDMVVKGLGTRPVALLSRGNIRITGNAEVDFSGGMDTVLTPGAGGGMGGAGPNALQANPGEPGSPPSNMPNVMTAQGAAYAPGGSGGGGGGSFGGPGGNGGAGSGGMAGMGGPGGKAYGDLRNGIVGGSGGAGAGGANVPAGSGGGAGGGLEIGAIGTIEITTSGTIKANGVRGTDGDQGRQVTGADRASGGGGGGSGGGLLIHGRSITLASVLSATGGDGGDGKERNGVFGGGGGGGAGGRILLIPEGGRIMLQQGHAFMVGGGMGGRRGGDGDQPRAGAGGAGTANILPEPSTFLLAAIGAVGLAVIVRRGPVARQG